MRLKCTKLSKNMKHARTFVASMSFQAPNSCKQCGVAESVDLISDCFMMDDQFIDKYIIYDIYM